MAGNDPPRSAGRDAPPGGFEAKGDGGRARHSGPQNSRSRFHQLEAIGMTALRAIVSGLSGLFLTVACATVVPAQQVTRDGIAFDDAKHRGWYVRFWTGSCKELKVICLSGAPYWSEIMQRLLANVPADRQERLRTRLVLLGQSIGYEWAKENAIRRIDNGHIKSWSADLKRNAHDPEPAVSRIEQQSRALLGGTGQPQPSHATRP